MIGVIITIAKDEDDLEGILDYLEPRSYDGFINLDDEAYNKRRCRLFGTLQYEELNHDSNLRNVMFTQIHPWSKKYLHKGSLYKKMEFKVPLTRIHVVVRGNECMTRSLTKKLFTPFKDPEQEFRSSKKHFKTLSLDESRSPDFDLFSDQEEYSKEEATETMAETMEQYMSKTRADYGSRVVRPKIEDKDNFELKGQFLKELQTNTFSGLDHEDANEHIKKVLEIMDLFHIPNITIDQVMLRAFPMSLTGAASLWLRNKPSGLITT
ncbi:hypothetical protein Tco_1185168 [Tanacetum coccineum]